jgi:hypothetical protein
MTTYKFVPGGVAAYLAVFVDDARHSCVYLSQEKGVVVGNRDVPLAQMEWPMGVKVTIEKHFRTVFCLRHEDWQGPGKSPRAQFLDNILPWTIEV